MADGRTAPNSFGAVPWRTIIATVAVVVATIAAFLVLRELTRIIAWLAVAGVFNALALGSLSRALSLLPVTRVNALSTLQVALSAAGGVLLFAEPFTGLLALGLLLSITGTVMAQQRHRSRQ